MPETNSPKPEILYPLLTALVLLAGLVFAFFSGVIYNNHNLQLCLEAGHSTSECQVGNTP